MRNEFEDERSAQSSNQLAGRYPVDEEATTRLERSSGATRLSFKAGPAGPALEDLYQQGCSKVRFPRSADGNLEAVLLNTAGGLTDGDTITNDICWRSGSRATVTTQAAERIYRAATRDVATVTTRISIDDDCQACWLPQETIIFDGARLSRSLEIDMKSSSRLIALESTVLGRRAMGEAVNYGKVSDRWRLRIDGRLVFADNFLLDDQVTGRVVDYLEHTSVTNTAHCLAMIVVVADNIGDVTENARRLVTSADTVIGASCLEQHAILRILATDNQAMHTAVSQAIASLRGTFDIELPRVWHC